ncbi:Carboxylesterase A [Austwickia sp. TVS 96-490-7B]|uniref:alpha/beta hydrolase n=1 Tax=Austwickia sp. TVS 96-490-7B TaxID=2830843 RepID=UPI001DD0456A|nr:alpha/beta hydrolase [Austwickia sp. TVS 96-490-7B]MBW3084884.1 Carboxylesterase A [Austwickia sp. TVS 96-490-7B]
MTRGHGHTAPQGAQQARRRARRTTAGWALILGVALTVSSCSVMPWSRNPDSDLPGAASTPGMGTPPPGQEALAPFYGQKLSWSGCGKIMSSNAECAWMDVPIDYGNPGGDRMKLRVLKVPAGDKSHGALFVNPGGPGGSATEYAAQANMIVTPRVRSHYDIVGVDPRGVGQSSPIVCLDDTAMDDMMGADPVPTTPEGRAKAESIAKSFGQACQRKYPKMLGHVSTIDAAKDMDIARAVLGQSTLTYLGKSYGTYLGSTYADLFPTKVGRLVLDGVMTPDLTDAQLSLGQAEGFETATRAYAKDCLDKGECPLTGANVDEALVSLREILAKVNTSPPSVSGDTRVRQLTPGWAWMGVAHGMYSQDQWPLVTAALHAMKRGNGNAMFDLAKRYANRGPDGHYQGNIMQVISAVNCLDHPAEKMNDAQRDAQIAEFSKVAPTWGPYMAGASYTCMNWPVPPVGKPHKVAAEGAPPILVVGTTRDPATPYKWAQELARQLKKGRLVTFDGDGHTAYTRSNRCVDNTVDDYLIEGKVPDRDVTC